MQIQDLLLIVTSIEEDLSAVDDLIDRKFNRSATLVVDQCSYRLLNHEDEFLQAIEIAEAITRIKKWVKEHGGLDRE
ncbi:hypothetical protein FEZ33_01360 [Ruoffia tabacinasalis]|uniref:Uncharacterized protein n=1 Tax=Ruoffia tabacinasalis TaxID=87458 RepID=A0A5R9EFR9_9LACT|nr:hypothetical protein [Ruoffia tabacinasalis]TLQ49307.1 hypothetical protein FEZ33_01360 [Ruoffia tabacinasalis]